MQLKPHDLVARLRAQGVDVVEQTIRVWESYAGRSPSPDNIEALERIFGSQAPAAAEGMDAAAIVAAIDRLAAAVEAQTRQQVSGMTALGESLGVVLARLGGLPEQMPDEQADQRQGVGR